MRRSQPAQGPSLLIAVLLGLMASTGAVGLARTEEAPRTNPSGLAVPRFVSLKFDRVFARLGPGTKFPIAWVYERTGLPVEVIEEYDNWRRIRDSESSEAWVLQTQLSGRRTVLIQPWDGRGALASRPRISVRSAAQSTADVVAVAQAGSLAGVASCDKQWCRLSLSAANGRSLDGYVEQIKLWGVYRDEVLP